MKTINPTRYSYQARAKAKQIVKALAAKQILIVGLTVWTFEGSNCYVSCKFADRAALISHLGARASNTGLDYAKFTALALRFDRRFSA